MRGLECHNGQFIASFMTFINSHFGSPLRLRKSGQPMHCTDTPAGLFCL